MHTVTRYFNDETIRVKQRSGSLNFFFYIYLYTSVKVKERRKEKKKWWKPWTWFWSDWKDYKADRIRIQTEGSLNPTSGAPAVILTNSRDKSNVASLRTGAHYGNLAAYNPWSAYSQGVGTVNDNFSFNEVTQKGTRPG